MTEIKYRPTHCNRCKQPLPPTNIVDNKASWFGRWIGWGEIPEQIICRPCWDRGERWKELTKAPAIK